MSTHIIDKVAAVKIPQALSKFSSDYYFVSMLSGDNNVTCSRTGRRARTWNPRVAGDYSKCLADACTTSAGFCGGMIRMAVGRSTPEGYIKKVRNLLDTAPDYNSPQAEFRLSQTAITFTAEEKVANKYYYDRLLKERGQPQIRDKVYLRGDLEAFVFDISNPREFAYFIDYIPYNSPLWHHVRVIADGEV